MSSNDNEDKKPEKLAMTGTKKELSIHLPETSQEKEKQQRKVVGLFWQILILTKKNFLLARRNVVGTVAEILVALLFVLILLLIRYVYDASRYSDQANIVASQSATNANPVDYVVKNINISTTFVPIIYYYPNNAYVLSLVTAAYTIINTQQPLFTATSEW